MNRLFIDIETFSSSDLSKCGVYKYCESPDFRILLFGYSVDGAPPRTVDLASGEIIPPEIVSALRDPSVRKHAHNASFERICLSRWFGLPTGRYLDPESWFCTMVHCAELGLPRSLEGAGAVMRLEDQKLREGKSLIRLFCVPKTEPDGTSHRILPEERPEEWELFKRYNVRDVETEIEIHNRLSRYPVPDSEWAHYHANERLNDRGVLIDTAFASNAVLCDDAYREARMEKARSLTGLANPASPAQLKGWLAEQGCEAESLRKASLELLIQSTDGDVREALELRQVLSKSSTAKYKSMLGCACSDDRARGLILFYGTHTGRYSGRLVQVQNLPKCEIEEPEKARELVRSGEFARLEQEYGSVPEVLSGLVRSAFIPKPGCRFFVADYSAVEARALAYLAGEQWRIDAFADGQDIYCASASQMFGVPVEKGGVNGDLRQQGKIAELALGYGGGTEALEKMGALKMGLQKEELQPLVNAWRKANPKIIRFWRDAGMAAICSVSNGASVGVGGFQFVRERGLLFVRLPSGRRLAYVNPRVERNRYGNYEFNYEGTDMNKKWTRIKSYGPRIVENLCQAFCRDLLAESVQRLEAYGFNVVFTVHDEVIVEAPEGTELEEITSIMAETPPWAKGLLLRADGFSCEHYRKD